MGRTGELFRGSCAGEEAGHWQVPQPHSPPTPQLLLGLLIGCTQPAASPPPQVSQEDQSPPRQGRESKESGWVGWGQANGADPVLSLCEQFPISPLQVPHARFLT